MAKEMSTLQPSLPAAPTFEEVPNEP